MKKIKCNNVEYGSTKEFFEAYGLPPYYSLFQKAIRNGMTAEQYLEQMTGKQAGKQKQKEERAGLEAVLEQHQIPKAQYDSWRKNPENKGRSVSDFVDWFDRNGKYYWVNGTRYLCLSHAIKAAEIHDSYDAIQKDCIRYRDEHLNATWNEAFQHWLQVHENNQKKKQTFCEKQAEIVLDNLAVPYKEECWMEDLLKHLDVNTQQLQEQVRTALGPLADYLDVFSIDLKNMGRYRYDFYVEPSGHLPRGALIEVDGSQHFQKSREYSQDQKKSGRFKDYDLDEDGFLSQVIRDQVKNKVAEILDIPILRISTLDSDYERIEKFLKNPQCAEFSKIDYYKNLRENIQRYILEGAFVKIDENFVQALAAVA